MNRRHEGPPQIAGERVSHPLEVALHDRSVQAELVADLLQLLGGCVLTEDGDGRIARYEIDHQEGGQADEEEHRHEVEQLQSDRSRHGSTNTVALDHKNPTSPSMDPQS